MRVERIAALLLPLSITIGACSFDLGKLFERDDPGVERARTILAEAGPDGSEELQAARLALEDVLRFRCENDGGQDLVIERPGAALDLGLVIFRLSELIGRRFGEEELAPDGESTEGDELVMSARARQLECAHLLLMKLARDSKTPPGLALRARYLLGNLAFLTRKYQDAIARYDEVLLIHPARGVDPATDAGPPGDDDAVARYAAWNRAIALERLQRNDAGPDADANETGDDASDAGSDGSDGGDAGDDGGDAGNDGGDAGNDGGGDGGADSGGDDTSPLGDGGGDSGATPEGQDSGANDAGGDDSGSKDQPQSAKPPPMPSSSVAVDLRELDRFDKKAPLDLDFKARMRDKRKIPKKLDK